MRKILTYLMVLILSSVIVSIFVYKIAGNSPKQEVKSVITTRRENQQSQKPVAKDNEPYFDEVLNANGAQLNLSVRDCVYLIMHEMINTKVVAEVTYATMEITPERVNALIKAVNRSNWDDKSRLLEILNRWSVGDFSQGVEEHNYVWAKLGGEVGKATGLKK